MDGWMDGQTDWQINGWTDRSMDGYHWMNEWRYSYNVYYNRQFSFFFILDGQCLYEGMYTVLIYHMSLILSVFLGGSCNPTVWRKEISIPILQSEGVTYYNPVSMERERERNRQKDKGRQTKSHEKQTLFSL